MKLYTDRLFIFSVSQFECSYKSVTTLLIEKRAIYFTLAKLKLRHGPQVLFLVALSF